MSNQVVSDNRNVSLEYSDLVYLLGIISSKAAHMRCDQFDVKASFTTENEKELDRLHRLIKILDDAEMLNPTLKVNSDGWLATDGTFYFCIRSEHDKLARILMRKLYNEKDKNMKWFEQQGWIRVYSEGFTHHYELMRPTEYQVSTLRKLLDMCEVGSEYEKNLLRELRFIER